MCIHIEKLNAWLKIAEFEVIENAKSSSEHSFNKGDTQSFSHLFVNSSFILLLHGFLFIYLLSRRHFDQIYWIIFYGERPNDVKWENWIKKFPNETELNVPHEAIIKTERAIKSKPENDKKRLHEKWNGNWICSSCNVEASPLKSIFRERVTLHTAYMCVCFLKQQVFCYYYFYHKCRYVFVYILMSTVLLTLHEANQNNSIPQNTCVNVCVCVYVLE